MSAVPVDIHSGDTGSGWALSPSRASDFMSCPLLYRFRVLDRLPEPADAVSTRGTLVHAVLERLFDAPAAQRTFEQAASLLEPEWLRLLDERPELAALFPSGGDLPGIDAPLADAPAADSPAEPAPDSGALTSPAAPYDAWLQSARELLRAYFGLEDPRCIQPAERELRVEIELEGGVRLRGFVDRVDVAPSGDVRIVDYKTGSSPSELFEAKALFQLKFYALVMWRASGRVPTLLQLIYLGDAQLLRYRPDEADLLATERKVRALWAAIERALERREFPPHRSRLCDWCSHQALCPEFGGTPPAYPEPVAVDAAAEPPVDALP
jgi:putative RecB family exonuclease